MSYSLLCQGGSILRAPPEPQYNLVTVEKYAIDMTPIQI